MADKKKSTIIEVSVTANRIRQDYFPLKLPSKVICHATTREEVREFVDANFAKVFDKGFKTKLKIKKNSKDWYGLLATSKEYQKIHSEYFVFRKNGKTIGWFMGEMEDFETFYMRNTGVLPNYQNAKIYKIFLPHFLRYLYEIGYQRVSSQHSTSNARIISLKMRQGFIVVGSETHDRWGVLIKLVKFLNPKREKEFLKLF